MENEQLVVNIPRRGTKVTKISMEDLQEIYQAREMLECYAIDILKTKNIRDLPDVTASVKSTLSLPMPSQDNKEEVFAHLKAFVDFHIKLIGSTGNSWVVHFYNSISSHLARYQFVYFLFIYTGIRTTLHRDASTCFITYQGG